MTAVNQDFSTYQGDAALPIFTVLDGSGNPIDISNVQNIIWNAQRNLASTVVIQKSKTGGSIIFVTDGTDGKFEVEIAGADTSVLTGRYIHQAQIIDAGGNQSTVATGSMNVGRAPIATYSGDPSNSSTDAVRFLIQDTNMDVPLLMDSEIAYIVDQYANPFLAAAQCCRVIAATFAQKVTKRVGDLSINFSDKSKQYLALAEQFDEQGATSGVVPYSGGISRSDKMTVDENTDRVKPPFWLKQFDNPNGPNNTSEFDPNPVPLP